MFSLSMVLPEASCRYHQLLAWRLSRLRDLWRVGRRCVSGGLLLLASPPQSYPVFRFYCAECAPSPGDWPAWQFCQPRVIRPSHSRAVGLPHQPALSVRPSPSVTCSNSVLWRTQSHGGDDHLVRHARLSSHVFLRDRMESADVWPPHLADCAFWAPFTSG